MDYAKNDRATPEGLVEMLKEEDGMQIIILKGLFINIPILSH